jgi:hypothetical protein
MMLPAEPVTWLTCDLAVAKPSAQADTLEVWTGRQNDYVQGPA